MGHLAFFLHWQGHQDTAHIAWHYWDISSNPVGTVYSRLVNKPVKVEGNIVITISLFDRIFSTLTLLLFYPVLSLLIFNFIDKRKRGHQK
jgi:hypothetical protein